MFASLFFKAVYATNIASETLSFYLYNNATSLAVLHVNFTDITTYNISYFVLGDIENLKVMDEKGEMKCAMNKAKIGTEISCYKRNDTQVNASLTFSFITSSVYPKQDYMIFNYALPVIYPTDYLEVDVYLPEGAVVVDNNNFETITPKPTNIGSDEKGRRFKIEWVIDNPELGKTYTFTIYYEINVSSTLKSKKRIYYVIGIFSFILLSILAFFYHHFNKKKEEKVIEILVEDEKKIIDAIKELGEGCKQKDVVKYTGFSKAKVSRIVEELKKRNVIHVEKVGKHNKLYLKK